MGKRKGNRGLSQRMNRVPGALILGRIIPFKVCANEEVSKKGKTEEDKTLLNRPKSGAFDEQRRQRFDQTFTKQLKKKKEREKLREWTVQKRKTRNHDLHQIIFREPATPFPPSFIPVELAVGEWILGQVYCERRGVNHRGDMKN